MSTTKKLAVLIDADNISADVIEYLLLEINKFGIASVKRIYGDWTDTKLNKWKDTLLPYAITPIQQFAYTNGKNATDMAMVIDAMDLLYSNTFDGFCLVSSDSDFTRLASRIRENGIEVIGFGQNKTPEAVKLRRLPRRSFRRRRIRNRAGLTGSVRSSVRGRRVPAGRRCP